MPCSRCPEVLGEVLAPDAQWYGVEDGQLCDGRKAIINVMSRNLAGRLRGRIEETIQDGSLWRFVPSSRHSLTVRWMRG
jgi:hypothetical protein